MTRYSLTNSVRILFAFAVAGVLSAACQTSSEPPSASQPAIDHHTLEKRANPVLKALKLKGEKKGAVRKVLESHFLEVKAWHDAHAGELSALWASWVAARVPAHKDDAKAAEVAKQIDAFYAQFKPQHEAFLAALGRELSPEQIEVVKNVLTKKPGMERTYKAYLQMIPTFTEEQKAFIHQKLEQAREMGVDSADDKETIQLFKLRKTEIESYIDAQGLDYKKAYKAFSDRIREESRAKKSVQSK